VTTVLTGGNDGLPGGWVWTRLADCVDILDSQRVPVNATEREARIQGKQSSELYPYYGATGQVGWIDDYLFDEQLVLLGEDGAPFLDAKQPKAYIIDGKSWVNNHAHVLRALRSLTSSRFLTHWLNTCDYREYVTGTTRLKLNQARMRVMPVPLPPLPEQRRIVAKIEELFTQLDAGVAALLAVKAQLQRYRQAVLKHAFEGKLTAAWREAHKGELEPAAELLARIQAERDKADGGKRRRKELPPLDTSDLPELPEGWVWSQLGNVTDVIRGASPRPKGDPRYFGGEISWVMISDVSREKSKYVSTTRDTVTEEGAKRSRYLKAGTLILSNSGTVCVPKILGVDACIHDGFVAFPGVDARVSLLYLYHYFDWVRPQVIQANRQGVTQVNLNTGIVSNLLVPLSSRREQDEVVDAIEELLSVGDAMDEAIDRSVRLAHSLRQSILKRAFEGKLVPQDPSDEPAEALLARIRAEREGGARGREARGGKGYPRAARPDAKLEQGRLL